jgi:hypothetical protein
MKQNSTFVCRSGGSPVPFKHSCLVIDSLQSWSQKQESLSTPRTHHPVRSCNWVLGSCKLVHSSISLASAFIFHLHTSWPLSSWFFLRVLIPTAIFLLSRQQTHPLHGIPCLTHLAFAHHSDTQSPSCPQTALLLSPTQWQGDLLTDAFPDLPQPKGHLLSFHPMLFLLCFNANRLSQSHAYT